MNLSVIRNSLLVLIFLLISNSLSSQALKDDYTLLFQNSLNNNIKVTLNDIPLCTNHKVSIVTMPKNGSVTTLDSVVVYTPNSDFIGKDSLEYTTPNCGGSNNAKLYINIVPLQDNIEDSINCFTTPPTIDWSFKQIMKSPNNQVDNSCIPLVGDIDNDGNVELVVLGKANLHQNTKLLRIYRIENNNMILKQTIDIPQTNRVNNPYAIASVDGTDYAAIFLCTGYHLNTVADRTQLIKYVYNPISDEYEESWRTNYSSRAGWEMGQPIVTDFNGDGVSEVLVMDKVFNAQTGALLVDGGFQNDDTKGFGFGGHTHTATRWVAGAETTWGSIMAVGDLDGDNLPDIAAGNTAYKVTINNGLTQDGTNKFEVINQVSTIGHLEAVDGATAIADMDGDGLLDIVVSGNVRTSNKGSLYIWNPRTAEVMHSEIINYLPKTYNDHSISVPFIGDIDEDGNPEICVVGYLKVYAFKYDGENKSLKGFWDINTNDNSVATGISMFDFDQDGHQELVYRDMTHLRILNGMNGSNKLSPIACGSSTANEYPVIADINNDQAAEIIVTSNNNGGSLLVFGSSTPANKWAPTRKVWNQYAYNAVNVNNDLTIPKKQLNPGTYFPGIDNELGTIDDIRPYNGYLQQQTVLSKNGMPIWSLPQAQLEGEPIYIYYKGKDSLNISVTVTNTGAAALQAPFSVSVYKDAISIATLISVLKYKEAIPKDSTRTMQLGIANFSTTFGAFTADTKIICKINDNGTTNNEQLVCNGGDTVNIYPISKIVMLNRDEATIIACDSLVVDVMANDSVVKGSILHYVDMIPSKGTVTVVDNKIVYDVRGTNCCNYLGRVDIRYAVCNNTNKDYCDTTTLTVNIVNCLTINLKDSCSFHPKMRLSPQYAVDSYLWQYVKTEDFKDDGSTIWTDLTSYTDVECDSLDEGYYRVKVSYDGRVSYSNPKKLVVIEKTSVGKAWWYQVQLQD